MQFNSYLFLLIFMPFSVMIYYFICKRWRKAANYVLLGSSLLFYVYYSWVAAAYMLVDVGLNYFLYRLVYKKQAELNNKKLYVTLAVLFNILSLFVFKYSLSLTEALGMKAVSSFILDNIIVPLGISFITFSKISTVVDAYKGKNDLYSATDYFLYILFFPKVISGPIAKANTLIPQFHDNERKVVQWENISKGLYGFSIGLAKKVLIADFLGILVDYCYSDVASCSGIEAICAIFAFSFQLYFDFSGYSDMAIGIAQMLNIDLPQNFNSPYKAEDIMDFWKRWHITLTAFLTQYIYYPLGGNRKGKLRQYINILIVFTISGIWHGAGLTFLVWGLIHGVLSVLTRIIKPHLKWNFKPVSVIITFILTTIAWVFFRANTITDAVTMLAKPFSGFGVIREDITEALLQPTLFNILSHVATPTLMFCVVLVALLFTVLFAKNSTERVNRFKASVWTSVKTAILLGISAISFTTMTSFIYGGF